MKSGWVELRRIILAVIAEEFSNRSSIGLDCRVVKGLLSQYIPDDNTLDEILDAIAERVGLDRSKVKSLFDRDETVPQFAERLLRSGALKNMRKKAAADE